MKLPYLAIAALALAVCGCHDAVEPEAAPLEPSAALLERARELEMAGRADEAIQLIEEHLASEPRTKRLNYTLARIYWRRGELDLAVPRFELELKLVPDHPDSHRYLGLAAEARGELEVALEHYRAQARVDPDNWLAHYALGKSLNELGRTEDAVEPLERAVQLDSRWPDPLVDLASIRREQGALDDSLKLLERALGRDALHVSANYNMGLTLKQLGREQASAAYLDRFRALSLRQDEVAFFERSPQYALGEELFKREEFEAAARAFAEAAALDQTSWLAYQRLGIALARLQRFGEAVAALKASERLRGEEFDTSYWSALSHARLGDPARALRHLDEARKIRALESTELVRVSAAFLDGGYLDEGRGLAEAFIEQRPAEHGARFFLGMYHHRLGEFDRAAELYEEAIALDASNLDYQVARAMVELARGNAERARQSLGLIPRQRLMEVLRGIPPLAGKAELDQLVR